jgi:hypothetical protein
MDDDKKVTKMLHSFRGLSEGLQHIVRSHKQRGEIMTAQGPKIKQLLPVKGDWFVVTRVEGRWLIERVVLWALMEATETSVEHVRAIDSSGIPHEDMGGDCYLVAGQDCCPTGQTWGALYGKTLPTNYHVREVTEAMKAAPV